MHWQALSAVAHFYQHPLSAEELQELEHSVPEDVSRHRSRVLKAAARGEAVHWCDILGSPPTPRGGFTPFLGQAAGEFRPPIACNGLVRFEGLVRCDEPGRWYVELGS